MEGCDEYLALLGEVAQLNQDCMALWQKVPVLKKISETQASYQIFTKATFVPLNDQIWTLSFEQEEKVVDFFPQFCHCFENFKNPLKTTLPVYSYVDMTEDLKVYRMLIPQEGLEVVTCLKGCMTQVKAKLTELQAHLDRAARLSRSVLETFELEDSNQTYWTARPNQDFHRLSLTFEMAIKDENSVESLRALNLTRFFQSTRQLPPFTESVLATQERHKDLLKRWIQEESHKQVQHGELLWRGTRDGFDVSTFHSLCDHKTPTLLLVRANNFLFGAYTTVGWSSKQGWKSDPHCFLFSLNKETKLKQPGHHDATGQNSVHNSPHHGPLFGASHDLYIADKANVNHLSSTCLGYSFQVPSGCTYGERSSYLFFCGERNFTVQEIEMWQISFVEEN